MPTIKNYKLDWLLEPEPGHELFVPAADAKAPALSSTFSSKKRMPGPRRTIARRGTQIFVAVGRQIRWGDLVYLKEAWEARKGGRSGFRTKREDSDMSFDIYDEEQQSSECGIARKGYRVLQTPVADDIKQLIIAPQGSYMAVLTSYTVHICLLPDAAHLSASDDGVLRPKYWTLGPLTHVTSRSPVVSALWHPLGVKGSCLVTVTEDAVVRTWELSPSDRWSFDQPTQSIDLKKLADGSHLEQDFTPSSKTTNKGFSPDEFDMQVASACFATRGSGGWSPFTLWIAMREGDVYALCPLLPKHWSPPSTLIPSLSVSIVANLAAIEDDPNVSPQAKLLAQQQLEWMGDLDKQEPRVIESALGEPPVEVYTRPSRPGAVPRLQGPLDLELSPNNEDDIDTELTDIFAIGPKVNSDELMMGEDEDLEVDEVGREGLSLSIICILSTSGQLRILLDLDGVEAQWLPTSQVARSVGASDPPSLLTYQSLDVLTSEEATSEGWPVFSGDVLSRYSFYVTHHSSITHVSLANWVFRLESELQGQTEAGSDFRIDLLANGKSTTRERLFTKPNKDPLAAVEAIQDPDLGYLLLSATTDHAVTVVLEAPLEDDYTPILRPRSPTLERDVDIKPLEWRDHPRPPFNPPSTFDQGTEIMTILDLLKSSKHRAIANQEVRLSAVTLEVFTDAHVLISSETSKIRSAVSELFQRCSQLQMDLRDQVSKARELKSRIEQVSGDYADDSEEPESDDVRLQRRIDEAKQRQYRLVQRAEDLRKRVGVVTSRELSDKERAWVEEVDTLESNVLGKASSKPAPAGTKQPWQRFENVKTLKEDLLSQAKGLEKSGAEGSEERPVPASPGMKIPAEIRKAKVSQVMTMLERETALVEATKGRLERLSLG